MFSKPLGSIYTCLERMTTGRFKATSALVLAPNLQFERMTHSEISMVLALFGLFSPHSLSALSVHLILDHDLLFEITCLDECQKKREQSAMILKRKLY